MDKRITPYQWRRVVDFVYSYFNIINIKYMFIINENTCFFINVYRICFCCYWLRKNQSNLSTTNSTIQIYSKYIHTHANRGPLSLTIATCQESRTQEPFYWPGTPLQQKSRISHRNECMHHQKQKCLKLIPRKNI